MRSPSVPNATAIRAEIATLMRFASVGLVATAVHLAVAGLALGLLGLDPQPANAAGFAVAFAVSYLGHHRFTFRSDRAHRVGLARFALVATAGYLCSAAALGALSAMPALPDVVRLLLAIAVIPAFNYVASRFWVY